jgi:O-antigen/teichoic acid export membrane protein
LPFYFGSAHCVGRSRAENRPRILGAFFTLSLIVAGLTLVIFSVSSSAGSSLLKTSSNAAWYACAVLIAVNTILTLFHGSLQAQHRFPLFASAKIAEVSLLLLGGTWMLRSGWGPAGAVSGYALAMTCILLYFVVRFKPAFVSWSEAKTLLQDEFQALRRLTFALGFLLILENSPAIWARYTLNETQSGYFGAIYNLRGAVWPFAMAVTLTFYSHLLAGDKSKSLLRQALMLIAGLAISFELGALLFSNWLVRLLYGNAFAPAAQYLALYGISLALQMAVMLLLFYRLGKNELRIPPLCISLVIFFGTLLWGNHSIAGIWLAQAAGAAACLVGLLVPKRRASSVQH